MKGSYRSFIIVGISILFVALILGGIYYLFMNKNSNMSQSENTTIASSTSLSDLNFNGQPYVIADEIKEPPTSDHVSKSFEWVTKSESIDDWTTLITTHMITSVSGGSPLTSAAYAQNVAALQKSSGAVTIETALYNTPEWISKGISVENPPYVLTYAFIPPVSPAGTIELDVQSIKNGPNGSVEAFVFARRLKMSTVDELNAYLTTDAFKSDHDAAVLASVPQ